MSLTPWENGIMLFGGSGCCLVISSTGQGQMHVEQLNHMRMIDTVEDSTVAYDIYLQNFTVLFPRINIID